MFYNIRYLCPRTDIDMGACGFCIQLFPEFKRLVALSELKQEHINKAIENCQGEWLKACGYKSNIFSSSIRVAWGEWGPEHITVPGNACGLDLEERGLGRPRDGAILQPHNIDSIQQSFLLLVVFTFFADTIVTLAPAS